MKKNIVTIAILLLAFSGWSQSSPKSPAAFLGYELGDRFTPHQRMVDYFRYLDEAFENVKVLQYGETYEHRPLIYATVASLENLNNLEQIRLDNLKRSGLAEGQPTGNKVAIVWLSYGVHGNESSSTEAAMKTLYDLASLSHPRAKEWLKNTVVIIDPCINPDGRDRYVNFYNQVANIPFTTDKQSQEHHEPWPGGRANHYLFDLNRDWIWETQQESQFRMKIYNQWMPHIHVDFHEQSPNEPYYFAPAAEPYHSAISPWQREFQKTIGKNNAHYFDEQGWLYFTKEHFDLYYPGYGDTYPMLSGAIGMTYEKGGGGGAGLSVSTPEGDPLTLKDRLLQHYTTGMSTIEIASQNASRLVDEFQKYFKDVNPSQYKSFVIRADNNPDKMNRFMSWMNLHGIQYAHPVAAKPARGFEFQTQTVVNVNLGAGDIVINSDQPKGKMVTTLLEPQSTLADTLTYDITAWNLIYGYNLKAFALTEKIPLGKPAATVTASSDAIPSAPYAYIFRYQSLEDVEFLAALIQQNVKVRFSAKPFSSLSNNFDAGTLIVTKRNNESVINFDQVVQATAKKLNRQIYTTTTGLMDKGFDFGSGEVTYLKPPKVALLGGSQTFSHPFGEIWHYFEQQIHYPVSIITSGYFKSADLSPYTVLIVPEGNYDIFDEATLEAVVHWTEGGGRLIVVGEALNAFADKKGFGLKVYSTEQKKKDAEESEKAEKEKEVLSKYGDAERKQLSQYIPGAIYKIAIDKSHPMAFGLGDDYYTLKMNRLHFDFLENGWNVGTIRGKAKPVMGYAGYKINKKMDNTLAFGAENKGRGQIIYFIDDPLFRGFWESGKLLFSNAVFLVGQ